MIYLRAKHRQVEVINSPDFDRTRIVRARQRGVRYPDDCYNEIHISLLHGSVHGEQEIEQAVKEARLAAKGQLLYD